MEEYLTVCQTYLLGWLTNTSYSTRSKQNLIACYFSSLVSNHSEDMTILPTVPPTHLGVILDSFLSGILLPAQPNHPTLNNYFGHTLYTICLYLSSRHYSLMDFSFFQTVFHASEFCLSLICLQCKSIFMRLLLKIFQQFALCSQT